jgi:hypothetical protein
MKSKGPSNASEGVKKSDTWLKRKGRVERAHSKALEIHLSFRDKD